MQQFPANLQATSTAFTQATIINGFALLGFSDGLTVIFEASTIRQLLPYAEFIYNSPLSSQVAADTPAIENF